jgi:hypothetical protein
MAESKDDDLLPQTSPEIIDVSGEQDKAAPDSVVDKRPTQGDRKDSETDEN